MENLEGKYFEKVITALQNAKKEERFLMRPEFRQSLRANLLSGSVSAVDQSGFDWSELVLKWKYLFGAVPVLAVLTIVAVNFYNRPVEIKTVPSFIESSYQSEKDAVSNEKTFSDLTQTSQLKTFSAALVMPPAEYLNKKAVNAQIVEDGVNKIDSITTDSSLNSPTLEEAALKIKPVDLKIDQYDLSNTNQQIILKETRFNDLDLNQKGELSEVERELPIKSVESLENSRLEQSGRIENNAKIENEQKIEQPVNLNLNEQKTFYVTDESAYSSNEKISQEEVLSQDSDEMSDDFIDPQLEINSSSSNYLVAPVVTGLQITPKYLLEERIKMSESVNRSEFLPVIMSSFSSYNGALSEDYYIEVSFFEDGNLKATLFQFGKVEKILIINKNSGQWEVVTEISQ